MQKQKLYPIFRFTGIKTSTSLDIAEKVVSYFLSKEEHEGFRLVEPFAGSASVTLSVQPTFCLIADFQPMVVLTLEVLRRKPIALFDAFERYRERYLQSFQKEVNTEQEERLWAYRKMFLDIRDNPPKDPIERAAWFVFITHAAYNWLWRVNQKGKCNSPAGDRYAVKRVETALEKENALRVSAFLDRPSVEIRFASFEQTLLDVRSGDVLYCDPPYVGQFVNFTQKRFNEKKYMELASTLRNLWTKGVQVIVHHVADPELAKIYLGWCRIFVYPVRRKVQPSKNSIDHEMIIISQSSQMTFDLFDAIERELLKESNIGEALWDEAKKGWVEWPPRGSYYQMDLIVR